MAPRDLPTSSEPADHTLSEVPGSELSVLASAPRVDGSDSVASTEELGAAPRSMSRDRSGEVIGHFRLVEKLGEGGMGVVYAARDERLGRVVALKILPAAAVASPERRRRFLREARAASAVLHPNIATIFEVGEAQGEVFLAMERVQGKTLRKVMREAGALEVDAALSIVREVALALKEAHAVGVVHRDLKPENVMQTPSGTIKVLDFGLAKRIATASTGAAAPDPLDVATVEGKILGTPGYMPPEQARGGVIDARADVFSLGAVLFELLTGQRAFSGGDVLQVLFATDKEPVPAPSSLNARVPPEVDALVARCLEKRPEDRFGSCEEVVAGIEGALSRNKAVAGKAPAAPQNEAPREPRVWPFAVALGAFALFAMFMSLRAGDGSSSAGSVAPSQAISVSASGSSSASVAVSSTAAGSGSASSAAQAGGEIATPLFARRQCMDGDAGKSECRRADSVAWCDPRGQFAACCGKGLVPKGEDGICGCAPGGTGVAEARSRGCEAVPADALEGVRAAKGKAMTAAIECFQPKLKIAKIANGVFEATYFLTPEGEVFGARVQRCTLAEEEAQSCALQALRATRFPPPAGEDAGKREGFGFMFGDSVER